jgi:hypothetical protein
VKQPLIRPDGDEQGRKPIDTQTSTGQHLRVFVVGRKKRGKRGENSGGWREGLLLLSVVPVQALAQRPEPIADVVRLVYTCAYMGVSLRVCVCVCVRVRCRRKRTGNGPSRYFDDHVLARVEFGARAAVERHPPSRARILRHLRQQK